VSAGQAETVANTGTAAVVISSIALAGTNASDFSQSNTCGSGLAAATNCNINVTFTASQFGPRSGSIQIIDNTLGSPHSVALDGVGLTSGPNASLSAASLSFGSQAINTTSSPVSITLSNYGTAALNISSVAASGNFSETDNCVPGLASAASCTISVTFTPSVTGSVSGTLTITDDAPGSSQTVSLSGTGTAGMCVPYGRPCSSTAQCCAGLKCVLSGGSTRAGFSCR
jgi:hypothetical protein